MIANATTLILGAGASTPTYPTGAGLRDLIVSEGLRQWADATDIERRFIRRFRDSIIPSIDAFLADESTAEMSEIGRHYIAEILLPCEASAILPAWYPLLFQAIRARPCEERTHKVKIVTFNYDLSLENTLFHAFRSAYGHNGVEEARAAMDESVEIIHVYGALGSLSFQEGGGRQYGKSDTYEFAGAAKGIKIIGRDPEDDQFKRAQEAIASANFVAILGFGYDETNIANLKLHEVLKGKTVLSTGYRMGYGMRAWLMHQRLGGLLVGHETHKVEKFLQKSAFLHWADRPSTTAGDMHVAINRHVREIQNNRLPA